MKRTNYIRSVFVLLFVGFNGCIEPFEAETRSFENAIVVDALLTDEEKQHQVLLTRTYSFEDGGTTAERNAKVQVKDNQGNTYAFQEAEAGIYRASVPFSAVPGVAYELFIETSGGKNYRSNAVIAPEKVLITELYTERQADELGKEGVGIILNNSSSGLTPTYFRFEYEETYKIIAPEYNSFEFEVVHYIACDTRPYEVAIKPRTDQRRVCFGTRESVEPLLASTNSTTVNDLSRLKVRFVGRENYIISHRYSILVKQYAQTQDAHAYYQQLGDFSSSDAIFSQVQPGFLSGNLNSESNTDENVLGYFEVASLSTERVYFNYNDLFPGEPLPAYAISCDVIGNPPLYSLGYHCDSDGQCDGSCESPLIEAILANSVVYQSENELPTEDFPGPYFTIPSPCGDCTVLGSSIVPEFWVD